MMHQSPASLSRAGLCEWSRRESNPSPLTKLVSTYRITGKQLTSQPRPPLLPGLLPHSKRGASGHGLAPPGAEPSAAWAPPHAPVRPGPRHVASPRRRPSRRAHQPRRRLPPPPAHGHTPRPHRPAPPYSCTGVIHGVRGGSLYPTPRSGLWITPPRTQDGERTRTASATNEHHVRQDERLESFERKRCASVSNERSR
jgi:hypothetical protein